MNSDLKAQLRELFIIAAKVFDFFLYRPQTKFARVMFYTCLSFCPGGVPGQVPPGTRYTPQDQCMLGDMGNKRAVRILLECILV